MPLRVERFARIAAALAALALHPDVGQKVHFHTPLPEPLAGLTTAARNIEGKRPWREPAGAGFRHLRKELPDVVEDARVGRRRRARRRADRVLVDEDHLVDLIEAPHRVVLPWLLPRGVQPAGQ